MSTDYRDYCGNENCRRFLAAGVCAACEPSQVEALLTAAEAALRRIQEMPTRLQSGSRPAANPYVTHEIANAYFSLRGTRH
jgi:hypothetical protein